MRLPIDRNARADLLKRVWGYLEPHYGKDGARRLVRDLAHGAARADYVLHQRACKTCTPDGVLACYEGAKLLAESPDDV